MAKLCEPQNLSVLIPYRDLEILMDYAKNYKKIVVFYCKECFNSDLNTDKLQSCLFL